MRGFTLQNAALYDVNIEEPEGISLIAEDANGNLRDTVVWDRRHVIVVVVEEEVNPVVETVVVRRDRALQRQCNT